MRLHFLVSTVLHLSIAFANTEILNLLASEHPVVFVDELIQGWIPFTHSSNERRWEIQPAPLYSKPQDVCKGRRRQDCPHDLWLVFRLDDPQWIRFSKFTFRISWPASSPADFYVTTFTPPQLADLLEITNSTLFSGKRTRNLYARVRVIDTGIPIPSKRLSPPQAVPFIMILEPLYFGILPQTLVPTILVLILVIFTSGFVLFPRVYAYLDGVAGVARNDHRARRE